MFVEPDSVSETGLGAGIIMGNKTDAGTFPLWNLSWSSLHYGGFG